MIRCRLVAPMAVAVILSAPSVRAQTEAEKAQIQSAVGKAEAFRKQGKPAEAAREYEWAVDLAQRTIGPGERETAALIHELALLYRALGRYGEAEPLLRRSLEIIKTKLGTRTTPPWRRGLHSLANLYTDMSRYGEAEPLFLESQKSPRDHRGA